MSRTVNRAINRRNAACLAFALCTITTAVNLQAPLYDAFAARDGLGVGATTIAFACYVTGVLPVLLCLNGLADRVGCKPLIITALLLCLLATTITLMAPNLVALGAARFLLGISMGLTSAVAPAYMQMLLGGEDNRVATNYVTASTALGFGLGAAMTSLFLFHTPSVSPPSLWIYLAAAALALVVVTILEDSPPSSTKRSLLRLPSYPQGAFAFGLAILLAWATVGLVIAILPSALQRHGLSAWSGFATFGICSCGVLFQPWARRFTPRSATLLGLAILPIGYAMIAWGAIQGYLSAVLLGTIAASSACYGFIYLGGLSGVLATADATAPQASAGYFLLAYLGFSIPVIITGVLIDAVGHTLALSLFGLALLGGVSGTIGLLRKAQ